MPTKPKKVVLKSGKVRWRSYVYDHGRQICITKDSFKGLKNEITRLEGLKATVGRISARKRTVAAGDGQAEELRGSAQERHAFRGPRHATVCQQSG